MDVYSLVTGAIALALLFWAGAIVFVWAVRPVAKPALFIRALACVGIAIVCLLAGMSTLNEGSNFRLSQIVYVIVGVFGLAGASHQSYRLFTERQMDIGRRDHSRRPRR